MRSLALLFAACAVSGAVCAAEPAQAAGSEQQVSPAVVLDEKDPRMARARECLQQIRESAHNDGDTVLVNLFAATEFKLAKVTAKKLEGDTDATRFGFEFRNRTAVKTVYWEADCRPDTTMAQRVAR